MGHTHTHTHTHTHRERERFDGVAICKIRYTFLTHLEKREPVAPEGRSAREPAERNSQQSTP
jgi:hypothetical protein